MGRFGLHFTRPDPLPEPPGRPFGLPGLALGCFGRSWGAPGALLGAPRRALGRLLGAPGVHLGAGRAPQALGDPILEALGLDFRAFAAVFQASRMLSCRKNRMFARTRDPARRSLLCARRLVRSTWNITTLAVPSMSIGDLLGFLGASWDAPRALWGLRFSIF